MWFFPSIYATESNAHNSKSLEGKESSQQLQFGGEGISQVTEVPVSFNFCGSQVERTKGEMVSDAVHPVSLPLDRSKHRVGDCTSDYNFPTSQPLRCGYLATKPNVCSGMNEISTCI